MCADIKDCSCEQAMWRAYAQLKESNVCDANAFATAVEIYRYHHPEVTVDEARLGAAITIDELSIDLAANAVAGQNVGEPAR